MTTTASSSTTDVSSLLAQAAQSIISGSTKSTLDVNTLVSALVTAKTAGQNATIVNKQSLDNTQLSAIGSIKSALSSLQTALSGLADGSTLSSVGATVSSSAITATTTTGAVAGNYTINVTKVATANKISSQAFTSSDTIGSGTLTIGLGSTGTMSLNVTSGQSLSDIASAINTSSNNPGVSASVITASDGQHLVIQSTATGAANTVSVTAGSGLNAKLNSSGYTTVTAGQDAQFTIDGNAVTSASNTVSNALTGVTLVLSAAAIGTPQTVTVATDPTATTKAINDFVTAYNNYVTTAAGLSGYNTTTATAGPLLGDSMLNQINNGLAGLISGGVTTGGKTFSLSSIGIDLQPDGTMAVDQSKLTAAVSSSSPAIAGLFNTTNGIGTTLNSFVNTYVQSSGTIDQRTASLNSDLSNLSDQATALTDYQNTLTAQYNAQFTALNTLMSQMQNNTQYLTQLFGGSSSAGALATNK
ncbi:flagellar filament capping protein FliD [Paraburkholderia sartisoli]|uniref:Flagellar hook-associated protein 2 n=1 Tax=Paraburkholderia sartisoli TaxID=83784 RepID=A0A1H4G3J5_9BURK|nr:flagellar filament capping protein FliD [Paraburkholderia sartisoli]SEB03498.1 flagellar hook-associated protein 2 [Paraburkholderia sartisoli]